MFAIVFVKGRKKNTLLQKKTMQAHQKLCTQLNNDQMYLYAWINYTISNGDCPSPMQNIASVSLFFEP